ncbi:head-tail connector protein [uncultured Enterococcus sp.]|uniref:head-tail connector protein n=1 Tax=uncultured Enterococcus sp. TaxID=167972 RepID=UPI002AA6A3F1|nr:head-tail connector protein [uncultured Enterococcus sp.]
MLNIEKDFEEIKIAMKIDHEDDDGGVKRAFISAVATVKGAIGRDKSAFYDQDTDIVELINTAVIMMANHYYDAASATIESSTANGTLREYDLGYTSIISLLKAEYKVFKEGETNGG